MPILNVEFKAKASNLAILEEKLQKLNPQFIGLDHQIDTYFNVLKGRLKLREGNIENALIFYERSNEASAKTSTIQLYKHTPDASLKALLVQAHGIKVVVDKRRKIYLVNNVKLHFDEVQGLGTFVEVEAIDEDGSIGKQILQQQCEQFAELFGVQQQDYVAVSYSDLMLNSVN
jgi:predicted adenylyl cyclase CyaB